jgi:hypothetical protein
LLFTDIRNQIEGAADLAINQYQYANYWPIAFVLSVVFAILAGISPSTLSVDPESGIFVTSTVSAFGQIFMCSTVAITPFLVIHDDWLLYQYGKSVRVNIYNLDRLNGLGRAVLNQF